MRKEKLSLPFYRSVIRLHCRTMWGTKIETFRSNSLLNAWCVYAWRTLAERWLDYYHAKTNLISCWILWFQKSHLLLFWVTCWIRVPEGLSTVCKFITARNFALQIKPCFDIIVLLSLHFLFHEKVFGSRKLTLPCWFRFGAWGRGRVLESCTLF